MAVDLVTIADLRTRAFALLPWIEAVTPSAVVEDLLLVCLSTAKDTLEEDLQTWWEHRVIRQTAPEEGDLYDTTEPAFDYYAARFQRRELPRWHMRRTPVVSVEGIRLQFGENHVVLDIPDQWIRLVYPHSGVVTVQPIGTTSLVAAGSSRPWFLPLLSERYTTDPVPTFCAIDYTAGWYDPTAATLPDGSSTVRNAILAEAYRELLLRAARIVANTASAGGASQNFLSVPEELKAVEAEVMTFKKWWAKHYKPPRMVVV